MSHENVALVRRANAPFSVRRRLVVAVVIAVGLAGCGKSSKPLSYQQRIRSLEALYARCGREPSDHDYLACLRRNEDTIKSYLAHLCPHQGGYTFEGAHEPCPPGP
jgi:hypothetical protein